MTNSEGSLGPGARVMAKHISISASKMRRVVDPIRYRSYEQVLMILEFMPYRACSPILQVISAAANASRASGLSKAEPFVSGAGVSGGRYYNRVRPRAQGRAYSVRKQTCHVALVVRQGQQQ
uniref:Large ribosomal subunit protein uL22c n=1 Tax=Selaginella remotifolia TaxID=137170 RepID=A0A482CHV8_SELRE|nr:ribosomal protein L22 [Selaginella remotifolia]QBL76263.1 ribosomal protein L22 [Selaginella remotifolia]